MTTSSASPKLKFGLCLALAALSIALYWPTRQHDFINYDDDEYVYRNPLVQNGITAEGVREAFTTFYAANWHPLTWLSLMLDRELFGPEPGGFHLVNLLLHAANTVLLFLALAHMTGQHWPSAFVAALFAVHPLHVESVAWVTERKDVLSSFFWMLLLWAYSHYARRPRMSLYLAMCLFLAIGLMVKPLLVTLPCVLLLCDIWPLGRWNLFGINAASTVPCRRLFLEKVPLFLLVIASSIITFIAQKSQGAVGNLQEYSIASRVTNAVVAYTMYLSKTMWPTRLAVFYTYASNRWPAGLILAAGLFLLAITAIALWLAKKRPALLVGWLWYLGTLVPMIGLVQVGRQSMADRYTYIPLTGVFIMVAWGLPAALMSRRAGRWFVSVMGVGIISVLMVVSARQISHWQNSLTLFEHVLLVTNNNWLAHLNTGTALDQLQRRDEAMKHYEEAIRIQPGAAKAFNNLGRDFSLQGNNQRAVECGREAVRLVPSFTEGHVTLASSLMQLGELDEAITHCQIALSQKPNSIEAHMGLGFLFFKQGKYAEAELEFREALRLSPQRRRLRTELGKTLLALQNIPGAISELTLALQTNPKDAAAHLHLAKALALQNKLPEAVQHCREAVQLKPDDDEAQQELARLLQLQRDTAMLTDR